MKLILIVLMLLSSLSFASADTRLTQSQAVQVAADFCQRIGVPVTVPGTAHLHTFDNLPNSDYRHRPDTVYQSYWEVEFEAQAIVEVIDATSVICNYSREGLPEPLGTQPTEQDISRDQAVQIATSALQATNQTEQLHLEIVKHNQEADLPGSFTDHHWHIAWTRLYHDIPFKNQFVSVSIQPDTGIVSGITMRFSTPPPQSVEVTISSAQADSVASAFASSRASLQEATLDNRSLLLVQPNNTWQGGQAASQSITRFAYVYSLSDPEENEYEIWVDAQTGNIIGGDIAPILADEKSSPKLPLSKMLTKVQEVRVYRKEVKGRWSKKPIAVLNKRSQLKMLTLFKATKPAKNAGPLALAEYKFVLTTRGKPLCELRYLPKTGRVGMGRTWGVVPDRFKTWMQALAPSAKTTKMVAR